MGGPDRWEDWLVARWGELEGFVGRPFWCFTQLLRQVPRRVRSKRAGGSKIVAPAVSAVRGLRISWRGEARDTKSRLTLVLGIGSVCHVEPVGNVPTCVFQIRGFGSNSVNWVTTPVKFGQKQYKTHLKTLTDTKLDLI